MKVKICGIQDAQTAIYCAEQGVDWIGLNFSPVSKRRISIQKATEILNSLEQNGSAKSCIPVFLFFNNKPDEIDQILTEFPGHPVQLVESDIRFSEAKSAVASQLGFLSFGIQSNITDRDLDLAENCIPILDKFSSGGGGTGEAFDWNHIKEVKRNYLLAGGLNPLNVSNAVATLHPYGVDTASGVEDAYGKKDKDKIKEFIKNAKHT